MQKSNVVAERARIADAPDKKSNRTLPNTSSNIVTLYKVNGEAAFESCDISGGQRIGQVKPGQDPESHTGVITLPPALLSIDDNYFLGAYALPIHIARY